MITITERELLEQALEQQDEASAEGGWFEWTPGQERPSALEDKQS